MASSFIYCLPMKHYIAFQYNDPMHLFYCRAGNVRFLRQNNNLQHQGVDWEMEAELSEFSVFDFDDILDATDNFSEENKLGEGGFGPVYKVVNVKMSYILHSFPYNRRPAVQATVKEDN